MVRVAPQEPVPDVVMPPPALDLSTVALLGQPKRKPSAGWRRWLYLATGTLVNLGDGSKEVQRKSLTAQVTGRCAAATGSRCCR